MARSASADLVVRTQGYSSEAAKTAYTFRIKVEETNDVSGNKRKVNMTYSVYAKQPGGYQSYSSPKIYMGVDGSDIWGPENVKSIWPRDNWQTLGTTSQWVTGGNHTFRGQYRSYQTSADYLPQDGWKTVEVSFYVTPTAANPTSVTISPNFIKDGKFNMALNDPVGSRYYKLGLAARNTDDTIISRDNAIVVYKTPQNCFITSDTEFLNNKDYYIENSGTFLKLVKDTDYHVGDDIETYFTDVYEAAEYQYQISSTALDKIYQLLRARSNTLDVSWVLYTYSDSNYSTLIGDNKLNVNNLCSIPNPYTLSWVTHTIEDANALDVYGGHPLSYYLPSGSLAKVLSKAKFTFQAQSDEGTCFGKTLSYAINNTPVVSPHTASSNFNGETYVLATTMADPYASDINYTFAPTVVNYFKPTISALDVKRVSAVSDTIKVSYTVNYFDGTGMQNLKNCSYDFWYSEDNVNWTKATNLSGSGTSGSQTYTNVSITGLDYKKPFYFKIEVSDRIGYEISPSSYLPKGEPVWNAYSKSDGTNVMKINGEIDFDAIATSSMNVLKSAILDVVYPVGSIYITATEDTTAKVEAKFGGTWVAFGTGRTLVGVDGTQTEFDTVEKTGGHKDLQKHKHNTSSDGAHYHNSTGRKGSGSSTSAIFESYDSAGSTRSVRVPLSGTNGTHNHTITETGTGDSGNLQPYITVYMYKRTV